MRGWLAVFLLGIVLSGCSASRVPVCQPGEDSGRNMRAAAGHVFVRIAEVLVGTQLVDHDREDRAVACAEATEKNGPEQAAVAPTTVNDPPLSALATRPAERGTDASASSHIERPPLIPGTRSETLATRAGRWILVRKADHTLTVFDADLRVKTYAVVLGADPVDPKLYEGDRRTPEGEYHIIAKHVHPEWQRFLLLDYPSADDRQVYAWSRANGLVPARGGKVPGTGGAVGIHGTSDDAANRAGLNWTYGCISLLSQDIEELYDIIPVGTPVVIEH